MVQVPIYQRQKVQLEGGSKTPTASADAFGAGIGQAQQQLGKTIASTGESIGASLGAQQNEQDAITAKIETANHDARVSQFANEQMLTGDPATAATVPDQVREFATKDATETAARIPQKYQGQFTAASQQNFLTHDTKLKSWALKTSFDYNGQRVDEAAGQQAGFLLQNPTDLPRAATAIRGVIDEMTVPEWKKNEFRERAGLQLMKPVIDGFLARGDTEGATDALKRMQTEVPALMGIKALPAGVAPQSLLSPTDRDNVIKTVWGEARGEGPDGQAAVASVIRNRIVAGRYGGTTGTEVVQAPGQFEPWQRADTRPQMDALKPGDPKYDAIGKIVDGVFGGQVPDSTNGATHFYSPGAQTALGRNAPAWAKPETKLAALGTHEFYAPEGAVQTNTAPLSGRPIDIAKGLLGADEREHNAVLSKFIGQVGGKNVDPATTAWCAAFVNGVLAKTGTPGTDSMLAKSFLNYGTSTDKPQEGDIVVLSRGDPNGWQGHVGFYAGAGPNGTIKVLGGNQGDKVSIAQFPASQVLGYRRIDGGDVAAKPIQTAQAGGQTMSGAAGSDAWTTFMRQSESRISGVQGQNEARTKIIRQNTDADLNSEALAIRDKGDAGRLPSLTDDKLKALYPPERYTQILQQRQADMDYFAGTSGWDAKPADERAKDLERLNPANSMPGPDYAYRAENYSRAVKLSADIERKADAQQKKFTDEAMKVAFDLNEKGQLTPAVVETLRPRIPHGEYKTLLGMIRPEGGKDDPEAIKDLEKNIERSPEEFSKMASRYLDQGMVKTETFRSFIKENRGSKKDDMPPSPMKSGRDFVRNSLDPGAFGPSSEMYLRAARERATAEYDAWAEANPEAKRSEAVSTAEDIVKRHSIVATSQMSIAVGVSPYFGTKTRDAITTQDVDDAKEKLAADIKANTITPNQAQVFINQLDSWEQITAQRDKLKTAPATGGSRGRR